MRRLWERFSYWRLGRQIRRRNFKEYDRLVGDGPPPWPDWDDRLRERLLAALERQRS